MRISNYAVRNYQFTLVIFLMSIALGAVTLITMPRSEDPEIDAPQFPIIVVYPGTSPKDMEELVVDKIEKRVTELDDIKRVRSTIKDGVAVIDVEYKYESDVEDKYQELVREVGSIRNELPAEIISLEVQRVLPSNVNILQLSLMSENAPREVLDRIAEELKDELEKIKALKKVEIHGLPDQQLRIDLRLEKMARLRIPLEAIQGAVLSEMANIPGGSVQAGEKSFNIKTSGNYQSVEEVARTIVYSFEGKNVLLQDVADVYLDFEETKHITRINGHRCVLITTALKPGNNISQVQTGYLPVIEEFRKKLPANVELITNFDQAKNVNDRLSDLGMDFILAILLVAITLLPLGFRAAVVVMISIPLSLSIGLFMLNFLGFHLNQLSIVGLVVALGLLVDDSIVVVENIERWLREGYSRMDATLKATSQIGRAVVGCTATLIIAFMPLVFLPEGAGDFIRSLPMAVIMCVLASMIVSLTIIPFLSSRLLNQHAGEVNGNIFLRVMQSAIHRTYAPLLNRALKRPVITFVIACVVFIGSLQLMPVIGFSLFPASEKPQFLVNVFSPMQSSLATSDSIARHVERVLQKVPEIQYFTSNVGKGNPRIYYNEIPENERSDFAQLFVQLDEQTAPHRKLELIEELRAQLSSIVGARIEVRNFEQGPPVIAPVEVRVLGNQLDSLRSIASRVESLLRNTEGTIYVNNPVSHLKTDIHVDIDRSKASALGIPTVNIDRTVRLAVAGLELGTYTDSDGEDVSILLTTPHGDQPKLDVFDDLYVNSTQGMAYPLSQVATIEMEASPVTINHYDKNRTVSVSAFVDKGRLADDVIDDVMAHMEHMNLPEGYTYQMGGEYESRQESFGGFGTIILLTVFSFIAVLILEFKTFKSTLIVLSVIPLGMVGALLALWITGNSLSFVAIIGLIALAGIEVKNSILLVDFTNQLRVQGKSLDDAIREAGEVRFLPIILTSLTAIGGLIPIAISTNPLIAPLAIVLIGGLVSSTLLSRIVTPVVYRLIPPRLEAMENAG
jgi:multidrug efflux pump subunit AcrB